MKLKDILIKKLNDFYNFLDDEFKKAEIDKEKHQYLLDNIIEYTIDCEKFIELIIFVSAFDNETAIKLYLKMNNINFDDIKDKIDTVKLYKYFDFFKSIVKI